MKQKKIIMIITMILLIIPLIKAGLFDNNVKDNYVFVRQTIFNGSVNMSSNLTNGTGLNINGSIISITISFRLPQGCSNGQIAEYNASSNSWICGNDTISNGSIINTWWPIYSFDFINVSNVLHLNWTTINNTIDLRDDIGGVGGGVTTINFTADTYNGDIQNGSLDGYKAAHTICGLEFSGSHMCDEFEMATFNDSSQLTDEAWVIAGGPKYVPASIPVNDCLGWTHGVAGGYLGNYWKSNVTNGGYGAAINCGTTLKIACCS